MAHYHAATQKFCQVSGHVWYSQTLAKNNLSLYPILFKKVVALAGVLSTTIVVFYLCV
jgi:hypothetical protein